MRTTPSHPAFDHPPPFYFGYVGVPPPLPLGMSEGYGAAFLFRGMRRYGCGLRGEASGASGPPELLPTYGPLDPMGGSLSRTHIHTPIYIYSLFVCMSIYSSCIVGSCYDNHCSF